MSGTEGNELFRNDGGRFTRVGWVTGAQNRLDGRGFAPADYDRDGDVDLLVTNNMQPLVYLENRVPGKRGWLVVQLHGRAGNPFGIGGRLQLVTAAGRQTREIQAGSGYLSSPPPEAWFGLGDATAVDRLEVRWPDGEQQVLENLQPNRIVVVERDHGFRYLDLRRPAAEGSDE